MINEMDAGTVGKNLGNSAGKPNKMATMRIFLLVFLFLISLVGAVLLTQFSSNNTILNLQKSSLQAAHTFRINNLLQKIVNESNSLEFSIRRFLISGRPGSLNAKLVSDSIANLRIDLADMAMLEKDESDLSNNITLKRLLNKKINNLDSLLIPVKEKNKGSQLNISSFNPAWEALNDSIYFYTRDIQNQLQRNLQQSLLNNES